MKFDINNEEDVVSIDNDLACELVRSVEELSMVSTDTVLSIESRAGAGVIPKRIRNMVTSVPSTHGRDELLRLLRTNIKDRDDEPDELAVLNALIDYIHVLRNRTVTRVVEMLKQDLELLNKLYVPEVLRTKLAYDVKSAGDIHVNMFLADSLASGVYNNVNCNTLRSIKCLRNTAGYIVLPILMSYLNSDSLWCCGVNNPDVTAATTVAFDGTIAEYIELHIRDIEQLEGNLDDIRNKLLLSIDTQNLSMGTYPTEKQNNIFWANKLKIDTYLIRIIR